MLATLATAGVSIKLPALSCDDKSDSTSASRTLSSPQTSSTKLRRSSGRRRRAESKTSLTFCHFSSIILSADDCFDLLPMFGGHYYSPRCLKPSSHQFSL